MQSALRADGTVLSAKAGDSPVRHADLVTLALRHQSSAVEGQRFPWSLKAGVCLLKLVPRILIQAAVYLQATREPALTETMSVPRNVTMFRRYNTTPGRHLWVAGAPPYSKIRGRQSQQRQPGPLSGGAAALGAQNRAAWPCAQPGMGSKGRATPSFLSPLTSGPPHTPYSSSLSPPGVLLAGGELQQCLPSIGHLGGLAALGSDPGSTQEPHQP